MKSIWSKLGTILLVLFALYVAFWVWRNVMHWILLLIFAGVCITVWWCWARIANYFKAWRN